ncbi:MAG: hypothetical protein LW870_19910 [Pirellula sp.]|nr:hypothetical protein [Pirellula sp.]
MMKRPIQTAICLICGVLLGADTVVLSTNLVLAQPPGFGGGPPFGGFGGGPPSFGGGFGGREGGFGSRDGGSREGGSREGGFGGFDPSMFLGRMDRNGNGMLDLDEMEGPARFMIERMARGNPSIDMSKPIPLSKITEAFQAMRNGGSSSFSSSSSDESMSEATTLVPGFGIKKEKVPVPGFGSIANAINIRVEEQDIRDADDRMGRYDTNRDGVLDATEVTNSRMTDAMEYDRNGDGKVTRDELAVRYAKRRQSYSQSSQSSQDNSRRDSRDSRGRDSKDKDKENKEVPNPFEKIFSYRITDKDGKLKRPAGLPEWFVRRDINVDNQVSMDEYSSKWNSDVIDEFAKADANLDGFITAKECLTAVKKGFIPGSGGGSSSAASSSVSTDTRYSTASTSSTSTAAPKAPVAGGVDPKMVAWMEGRMKKYDKNSDNKLDVGEFKAYDANGDFGAVDQNKDGLADVTELVIARQKK